MPLEHVDCPRCGGSRSHAIAVGRDYLYGVEGTFYAALCDHCGLAFQNPRPPIDRIESLYPSGYTPHEPPGESTLPAAQREYLRRRLGYRHLPAGRSMPFLDPWHRWLSSFRLIPHFVSDGVLLEIGCGSGGRLRELRALGWRHLKGIEIVESAASTARSAGFDVAGGAVEQVIETIPDGSLDVVVASMVIEHLTEPFRVFDAVARKLKPGGELLFSTVVRDVLESRIYGPFWAGFDFPRHMVYFTRADLLEATRSAFTPLEIVHQVAPVDFARSSSWRAAEGVAGLFDRLMRLLGHSLPAKGIHLILAWMGVTSRVSLRGRRIV